MSLSDSVNILDDIYQNSNNIDIIEYHREKLVCVEYKSEDGPSVRSSGEITTKESSRGSICKYKYLNENSNGIINIYVPLTVKSFYIIIGRDMEQTSLHQSKVHYDNKLVVCRSLPISFDNFDRKIISFVAKSISSINLPPPEIYVDCEYITQVPLQINSINNAPVNILGNVPGSSNNEINRSNGITIPQRSSKIVIPGSDTKIIPDKSPSIGSLNIIKSPSTPNSKSRGLSDIINIIKGK